MTKQNDQKLKSVIENNATCLTIEELKNILDYISTDNLDDYIQDEILKALEDTSDDEVIALFNRYCENNNYYGDIFNPMDENYFNAYFSNYSYFELVDNLINFSTRDGYFREDDHGWIESFEAKDARAEIMNYYFKEFINYIKDINYFNLVAIDEYDTIKEAINAIL